MWLFVFSVLGIGSVQSLSIGYPYRTLLTYGSTRSSLKIAATQGFLIYLDNFGIERIVSYNYAEPVYAISQISPINSENPTHQTFEEDGSSEAKNVKEAHFRAWSLQQYQVLKREIDLLRAEGKEPSIEMLLKFLPLEKIALTADYATIAELPEIKLIRKEHSNIWNQVLLPTEGKPFNDYSKPLFASKGIIGHENQIAELKQLELQTYNFQNDRDKTNNAQSNNRDQSVRESVFSSSKISDEDKIFKPEATEAQQKIITKNDKEDLEVISVSEQQQSLKQTNGQDSVSVPSFQVFETPEIKKADNDHLNLQLEAKKQIYAPKKMHSEIEKIISAAPAIYVPKPVIDTVEVIRLRDEHLRIVNEAILKAKFGQAQEQQKELLTKKPDDPLNEMKVESVELNPKME